MNVPYTTGEKVPLQLGINNVRPDECCPLLCPSFCCVSGSAVAKGGEVYSVGLPLCQFSRVLLYVFGSKTGMDTFMIFLMSSGLIDPFIIMKLLFIFGNIFLRSTLSYNNHSTMTLSLL